MPLPNPDLWDIGTRPEKISLTDVMPDTIFQKGYDWMRMDVSEAEEAGYITNAIKLPLKPEEQSDFEKALLFERIPEILNHGHLTQYPWTMDILPQL